VGGIAITQDPTELTKLQRVVPQILIGLLDLTDDLVVIVRAAPVNDKLFEDRIRIEVLFGLIDDQRTLILEINHKIQQKQDNASRIRPRFVQPNALPPSQPRR
jgi:hypothetical protein